jgi:hypothetical protein
LYAGGGFFTAGDKVSAFVAKALLPGLEAHNATYVRAPGLSLKVALADVVTEVNGNPVTVVAAGPSVQGTPVTWDNTYLFYEPSHDQNDSFSYTVSNGESTSTGIITVNVTVAQGGVARSIAVSGGSVTIKFSGVPGRAYHVQRTTSLNGPVTWTTLTSSPLNADADGSFSYTDPSPPAGMAYYRSLLP